MILNSNRLFLIFCLFFIETLVIFAVPVRAESESSISAFQMASKQAGQISKLDQKMEKTLSEQREILAEIQRSKMWMG